MRRPLSLVLATLAVVPAPHPSRAAEPPRFEWKDGDRVVMIGDALIERDQKYGYLETLITLRNPGKTITFRNLGWSGDTVHGVARAGFGKPQDGFKHLVEHVLALKPTVLIVGYGMTESFDGAAGLPRFTSGLNALLDALEVTKARVVLLSPIAHENLGRPLPDPAEHNKSLRLYSDAIRDCATARGARFIDLFESFEILSAFSSDPIMAARHHTDDGIHPNDLGAYAFASVVDLDFGSDPARATVKDAGGRVKVHAPEDSAIEEVEASPRGLRFEMTTRTLPVPWLPGAERVDIPHRLAFDGLADGRYVLSIDGRAVAKADAGEWARSNMKYAPDPEHDQVEKLRQVINEKNRLYFYRWRPQNETYLFGFRKHEQGNNAHEIPLFDPLVEEKEKEIARLKVPVRHTYELVRDGERSN